MEVYLSLVSFKPPSLLIQSVTVPWVSDWDCQRFEPVIAEQMICAGGTPGTAICYGDSGGKPILQLFLMDSIQKYYLF